MSDVVGMIVRAQSMKDLRSGHDKKQWVMSQVGDSMDPAVLSQLIDDIVALAKSKEAQQLFANSSHALMRCFCRKSKSE